LQNELGLWRGGRLLTILAVMFFALTLLLGPAASAQADLDCADFSSREEAQQEFESDTSDPNRLDADDDGQACEEFDYDGETTAQETTNVAETTTAETTTADNADSMRDAHAFRCEFFLRVVRDDSGALKGQYSGDEVIVQRFEQCISEDVFAKTIPDRKLPFTGGMPLLGLAAIGLASLVAGASVLRAVTRRRG
jgi:hypothetical protein